MTTNVNKDAEGDKPEEKPVTDADLAALKEKSEQVEGSEELDENEDEAKDEEQSDEDAEDEEAEDKPKPNVDDSKEEGFKKKFDNIKGNTPDEYAANLEVAYDNSTAEALKWKKMYEDALPTIKQAQAGSDDDSKPVLDPALVYAKQKMDEEMNRDIADFAAEYSQMRDPEQYALLEKKVGILTKAIQEEEKRMPTMKEVLTDAATLLKWEPDSKKDDLNIKVKDNAAGVKTNSSAKAPTKSKVTADQVKAARALNPMAYLNKTDAEVAKELEPYV